MVPNVQVAPPPDNVAVAVPVNVAPLNTVTVAKQGAHQNAHPDGHNERLAEQKNDRTTRCALWRTPYTKKADKNVGFFKRE